MAVVYAGMAENCQQQLSALSFLVRQSLERAGVFSGYRSGANW
jgi:hypothetical protein